jgi:arylsulfatase A-like enzyme
MRSCTRLPLALAAAGALLLASSLFASAPKAPNVIVILADEMGYGDVGFNGGKDIPTPALNRIAAGGVVCTQAYLPHPGSSVSRAALLTGRYPQRFGLERSIAWRPQDPAAGLPATEKTLAEALRPRGYKSGLIGKWHLGAHDSFHPNNRGFDEFFGFLGGGHQSFPEEFTIRYTHEARNEPDSFRTWILRGMEPVRTQRHLTDDLSIEALDFIRRHSGTPFFLFLSYNAPRPPLQVPEKELAAFSHIENEKRRAYAALITMMDRGVGQVLDLLDSLELADDTLVFFLSSGGGDTPATGALNGGLRGIRGEMFEGGVRVPFAARWPARLPAGALYRQSVSVMDIFATVAAAAGVASEPARPPDGVNLVPYLRGENTAAPHERLYIRNFDGGAYAVREGNFKMIKVRSNPAPVLFNLANDRAERSNIAPANASRIEAMQASFDAWNAQMIEPTIPGVDMKEWKQPQR